MKPIVTIAGSDGDKPPPEYMELSEESRIEQQRHAETMRLFETRQRARSIIVPTAIPEVKARLRELGHPITLFAEDAMERRERLRRVIAEMQLDEEQAAKLEAILSKPIDQTTATSSSSGQQSADASTSKNQKEVFYTNASEELIAFRRDITPKSFEKAQKRLQAFKTLREDDNLIREESMELYQLYEHNKELVLNLSQFGDDRPLSSVRYSSNGGLLASGSLNPIVKVWGSDSLNNHAILRGHSDRITRVAWQDKTDPSSSDITTADSYLLASSSADGSCLIWDCKSVAGRVNGGSDDDNAMDTDGGNNGSNGSPVTLAPIQKLKGHNTVVSSCEFHPFMRNIVGVSCHDFSWRLWDIETSTELQLQDGHIKECTAISFHKDGSLVFTADAGGVGLLWDLRSGQMLQGFQGHIKKITNACFNSNGYQVATGSIDNTVKIWDLRKRKCAYTLPAHSNVISDVRYSLSGELLLTSSFDGTCKVWNSRNFSLLRTLNGHTGKVMACDFAPDQKHVISVGYDRTVKLWAHKDEF